MSIQEIQEEIASEFNLLDGNRELVLDYLMEIGTRLSPLAPENYREENLVKGCQSKVWLVFEIRDGLVHFSGDSNTEITKGLLALLIRVFSGQSPDQILNAEVNFIQRAGLDRFIGTQRSNGFGAMIKQMKYCALAAKAVAN